MANKWQHWKTSYMKSVLPQLIQQNTIRLWNTHSTCLQKSNKDEEIVHRKDFLDEKDLKRAFEVLGQPVTSEDLTNMIKMVGVKGKDKITLDEFKEFFKNQL